MANIDFVEIDEKDLKLVSQVTGIIVRGILGLCGIERTSSGRIDEIDDLFRKRGLLGKNVVIRLYEVKK